ncbi:MAG: restriction endonuclease-like protein [Treponema sp.]|uniref:restriction endonuclease-like protein n=1 Tax=Treponema sp. TaxID=166 RepID=UPI00298E5306|nr:restriction endonuclease-like protein [Treponema sp.]MCR5385506.1 restriction endonuclease-like protein [Treponema sp.]
MASHLSGSRELVYIKTDKVSVTIKGNPSHPYFQNSEYDKECSELEIHSQDPFYLSIKEKEEIFYNQSVIDKFLCFSKTIPLFYEQQRYEIIIESEYENCAFWHENLNVRKQVSRVGRNSKVLSGILNFGNDIGNSDLVILLDGKEYLRIVIEVFPSKIEYKKDYQELRNDVANEVIKILFDFNKKTYEKFGSDLNSSSTPTEFYTLINYFYDDFIKAVDVITNKPHHLLQIQHYVTPAYKTKQTDLKTIKWLQKHPEQIQIYDGKYRIDKLLSPKKIVTFDTKENRFVKYILSTTKKKLETFRYNYLQLNRERNPDILLNINKKVSGINRRLNNSFLKEVSNLEPSFGMSLVFSMALGYRDLYKYYLILIHGLSFLNNLFNISVKDIAQLYEYWCFIKLNSILREKYNLLSRDFLKVDKRGIFYTLTKGHESKVSYINPINSERITLSYNPSSGELPTVFQKPDNVLSIEKKSSTSNQEYKYIFDAKYRINPALPGTFYKEYYKTPGPEEDTINTMHRYRDAIVYENNHDENFKRSMFGAYVLFPYNNEDEYRKHKFFESIRKVNVGGLPFLPSSTELLSNFIDELVGDSPDSAFERSTLPVGIGEKLAKVNWNERDVLIGELRDREQYDLCLNNKFYHAPANQIPDEKLPIHYVAIYKSKNLFPENHGIYKYGEVIRCYKLPRNEIKERSSSKTTMYYKFEVKEWIDLNVSIGVKDFGPNHVTFTNFFLLDNSTIFPELFLKDELEYRLYHELKYHINDASLDKKEIGFVFKDSRITFENGEIVIYKDNSIRTPIYSERDFVKHPSEVFRSIINKI